MSENASYLGKYVGQGVAIVAVFVKGQGPNEKVAVFGFGDGGFSSELRFKSGRYFTLFIHYLPLLSIAWELFRID